MISAFLNERMSAFAHNPPKADSLLPTTLRTLARLASEPLVGSISGCQGRRSAG